MKSKRVIEGRITSSFGGRRDPVNGAYRQHQGVDIAAVVGTAVYAPMGGVVSAVYGHPVGGVTVILRSGCGGYRFGMCHLDSVSVSVGDIVEAGGLVAYSGNSGRSTGPHLHFSVKEGGVWRGDSYVGGRYVDPVPFLDVREKEGGVK